MSRYKRLLFVNDYPPSTVAGSPVIVRQYLRHYPMDSLDVLCCDRWYSQGNAVVSNSYLPCPHHRIPAADIHRFRPRRFFVPATITWNYFRLGRIMEAGRRLIRERAIEAIYSSTCSIEFNMAAYRLSQEFGLPLFLHEMDDWLSVNPQPLARIKLPERIASLRAAEQVWAVSPAMVRGHRRKYGIDCEYLHHILDSRECRQKAATQAPPADRFRIAYTGSINRMFQSTMERFCDWLNQGVEIGGKPVEMVIYNPNEPARYLGPAVRWGGFVPMEEVPEVLGQAHVATVLVSFTEDPSLREIIRTSIFTKTVDYLATGVPVLVVAPSDSGQVDYFGRASLVVDQPDTARFRTALESLFLDNEVRENLRESGFALVDEHHGMEALERKFLSRFRTNP